MIIAVDYTLAKRHIGGMGVFVRNTIRELQKVDRQNVYDILENPDKFDSRNLFTKIYSVFQEHFWYQTKFPSELNKIGADLLYSPNPPIPLLFKKPIILTIPDMAFFHEEKLPFLTKKYLFLSYFLAAHKAKKITTFSEYSKKDIQKILDIKPKKIKVIPLATSAKFRSNKNKAEVQKTLKKYKITKPYILCTPGTFMPRKNVKDLILAVSNLPKNISRNLTIILVGKDSGADFERLKIYINQIGMNEFVTFTGYVEPESKDIVNLYSAAKLFVYPSLYEGFGLPPLEAMACGTPVIVYNKTSLPEVVGGAGIIVNNHRHLTKAVEKLLKDKKLYAQLVKKGLERAKKFSWRASAVEFKGLIDSL